MRTPTIFKIAVAFASLLGSAGVGTAAQHCVNPGGTGGCFATIQAAIDASASSDTIQVAAGTYNESLVVDGRSRRLTISGAGAASTIVDAGNTDRVLGAYGRVRLVVEGMTLRNGMAPASFDSDGGCVLSQFDLTLRDVVVRDCSAAGLGGGVSGWGSGRLTIERSTVTANTGGYGGGVSAFGTSLTIIDSTIEGNSAYRGGGIFTNFARLRIANSTISGNVASFDFGGGLYQLRFGSTKLVGVTIAGNSAATGGGGLAMIDQAARIRGTIIADNTAPAGPDCYSFPMDPPAQLISKGYNLIEDDTDCSMRGTSATDVIGADPMFGPLAANGGPTRTHALLAGSPAIDTGIPVVGSGFFACRPQDQRGFPRNGLCDIGAYEAP